MKDNVEVDNRKERGLKMRFIFNEQNVFIIEKK